MNNINIITLNVKGLGAPTKRSALRALTGKKDYVFLQETHTTVKTVGKMCTDLKLKHGAASSYKGNAKGAAILLREGSEKINASEWNDREGRIAAVAVKDQKGVIGLCSIYAPTIDKSVTSKSAYVNFLISVREALTHLKRFAKRIVMGGDFNILLDANLDSYSLRPTMHPVCIQQLKEILTDFDLVDMFRHMNPETKSYTFSPFGENKNKTFNRLDYMFASDSFIDEVQKVTHEHVHFTDHKAVCMTIGKNEPAPKAGSGVWKHNDLLNSNEEYKEEAKMVIRKVRDRVQDPHERWEQMKEALKRHSKGFSMRTAAEKKIDKKALEERVAMLDYDPLGNIKELTETKAKLQVHLEDEERTIIFRSRVRHMEEGEKCTKFFFRQIEENARNSDLIVLKGPSGETLSTEETESTVEAFYRDLLRKRNIPSRRIKRWHDRLPPCKLSEEDSRATGGPITMKELHNTLTKSMHKDRAPGNDGLSVAWYQTMWEEIKDDLYASLITGLERGKLARSQRQSVIRLIKKKDKDPSVLKNWRPISLLNVDYKILSKSITRRLEKVVGTIIGKEQHAFVKGRQINDGIRTLDYLIEYTEIMQKKGALMAIDLEKAFDSISHKYIWITMERMGLDTQFIDMVKTLYNGAESAVLTNGDMTSYFPLGRSCRQGDALSPLLFIVALEPLLKRIRESDILKGMEAPEKRIKYSAFADDLTVCVSSKEEIEEAIAMLKEFEGISGLKVNETKSELLTIGEWKDMPAIKEVEAIKITGVLLGKKADKTNREKANYEPAIRKLERKLNQYKGRNLTIVGRTLILKAHGLSQIQFLAGNTGVPTWAIKEVKKLVYNFLWKGPDKISRIQASKRWEDGGIKMPLIEDFCAAAAVQWLRKYEGSEKEWHQFMTRDLNRMGGRESLNNDHEIDRIKRDKKITNSTKSILESWKHIQSASKEAEIEYGEVGVWYNKRFKKKKGSIVEGSTLPRLGFHKVKDFIDQGGKIVKAEEALRDRNMPKRAIMEWNAVIHGMDKKRTANGQVTGNCPGDIQSGLLDRQIEITASDIPLQELTQSKALKIMSKSRADEIDVPYRRRMTVDYGVTKDEWNRINRFCLEHSNDSKSRSLAFRMFSGLTYANKDFHKFEVLESPACTHCGAEVQTQAHLYMDCAEVKKLREKCAERMGYTPTEKEWYFGTNSKERSFVLFELNKYINEANFKLKKYSIEAFLGALAAREVIERHIAEKNDKERIHHYKWRGVWDILDPSIVYFNP